jgi:tripartite-type tricarboxylate transporter receptor subunit TctC
MFKKLHLQRILATTVLSLCALSSWGQANPNSLGNWPDKPIKFTLSQPPGSGPDNIARMLGDQLSKVLSQPIVIDNKPGGQNIIGAQAAARAPADGLNFYFATTAALVTNKYLFKSMPYDPQKDFTPVAFVASSPFGVMVKADSHINSIQELLEKSKNAPGTISIGNEGPRTFGGIIARLINARSKAQANLVSYASIGVATQDLMGGHTDALVADLASTGQLIKQGKLKLLAVTSPKRVAGYDAAPPLSEYLPGFEMTGWLALVAPTGTPVAIVSKMNKEINQMLSESDLGSKISNIGPIATAMGGVEQFDAFLKKENERWSEVTKEIGLLPE